MEGKVVTRFAPSPTGLFHLGTYRTAIFSYLFAKKYGGAFILRIEDTDKERSKKEYEEDIIASFDWLSIPYDALYRQSDNLPSHVRHMERLIQEGRAYISEEEAKDGSGVMRKLVRLKNPNKVVTFNDLIRGPIEIDTTDLGDFVIAKSINEPLFHLAVVIDDHEEGVTHVFRGEEHIPNTPRQILIAEALGFPHPTYVHLPLVLGEDRTKLSKRKGAFPIRRYRELCYIPEAIFNFMTFVGFNPGGEQEIFSRAELIGLFDTSRIQKSGAFFDENKLLWMNKEYMKKIPVEEHFEKIKTYLTDYEEDILKRLTPSIIDRISYYGEIEQLAQSGEFSYVKEREVIKDGALIFKTTPRQEIEKNLSELHALITSCESYPSIESVQKIINNLVGDQPKGPYLHPLRVALSRREKSIDPFTLIYILGRDESLARIEEAITRLKV